jgi:hypothetical protein
MANDAAEPGDENSRQHNQHGGSSNLTGDRYAQDRDQP